MSNASNRDFGWFGKFSVAGFLVMSVLAIADATMEVTWPLSTEITAGIAVLAGLGAVLLYVGHDPTAPEVPRDA